MRIVVDSRIRIPLEGLEPDLALQLRRATTHANPAYSKQHAMGFRYTREPPTISTWRIEGKDLTLPSGAMGRVRKIFRDANVDIKLVDTRTEGFIPSARNPLKYVGFPLRAHQVDMVEAAFSRERCIIRAATGCLSGGTIVELNRAGKSFKYELRWLVQAFAGGAPHRGPCWDPEIATKIRMRGSDGFIRLGTVADAYASGRKTTYLVETSSGKKIRATLDHRFMTEDGWKRLGKIVVGERVFVDRGDGGWKKITARAVLDTIVGISDPREEDTFDVAIEEDEHNFLADGFVVHNSGKTEAAFALAAKIGLNTLVVLPNAKLLNQWQKRAKHTLNLNPNQVGIIRGAKRTLRPLTLATQQTLWSREVDEELQEFFGAIIIDECFEARTPVLMEDGMTRPISEIREGDRVALGGKVVRTMCRFYEGSTFLLGGFLTTPEHPIATSQGWVPIKALDSGSYVYHDPLHARRTYVSRLQEATPPGLSGSSLLEVSSEELQGRPLHELREARSSTLSWSSSINGMRNEGSMECRIDLGDFGLLASNGRSAAGQAQGVFACGDACALARSTSARSSSQGFVEGSEKSLFTFGGSEARARDDEATSGGRHDGGLWRPEARQRAGSSSDRVGDVPTTQCVRVRDESERANTSAEGQRVSGALQDRLDASCDEDRRGDRWQESPGTGGAGCQKDILPRVDGVVGLALPGSVRLRHGRADVRRGPDTALSVYNLETENGIYVAAGTLVHNCHHAAARTFVGTLDKFPARYRIGFSANERRKDRKEFITYDILGDIAHEVSREECERVGAIVDVDVRVVMTDFSFDQYRRDSDFNALLEAMTADEARNKIAIDVAMNEIKSGEQVILLTHRREHARTIDREMVARGVASGCLLGAQEPGDEAEFERMYVQLNDGTARAGVGTYQALGEGIDLPAVSVGVVMTPIATNQQMFNQVRGRICRPSPTTGKTVGRLYVLFDRAIFDERVLRNIVAWNRTVNVQDAGRWISGKEYLRQQKTAHDHMRGLF